MFGSVVKLVPACPSKLSALLDNAKVYMGRQMAFPYFAFLVLLALDNGSAHVSTGSPLLVSFVVDDGLVEVTPE